MGRYNTPYPSSRSSSKSGTKKKTTITIHEAKFKILEDPKTPSYVDFQVEKNIDGQYMNPYNVRLGVISCWADPATNFCVKAHLFPSEKSLTQMMFLRDLQKLGETGVYSTASGFSNCTLLADTGTGKYKAIRYGIRSTNTYQHRGGINEDYQNYYIYDTKAIALLNIIDHLRLRKTIAGLSMVNFTKVPDDILQSAGFEPVPDLKGNGFPMWKGNPESITEASSGLGYGGTRWDKEASNGESFLNLIQKCIQ